MGNAFCTAVGVAAQRDAAVQVYTSSLEKPASSAAAATSGLNTLPTAKAAVLRFTRAAFSFSNEAATFSGLNVGMLTLARTRPVAVSITTMLPLSISSAAMPSARR